MRIILCTHSVSIYTHISLYVDTYCTQTCVSVCVCASLSLSIYIYTQIPRLLRIFIGIEKASSMHVCSYGGLVMSCNSKILVGDVTSLIDCQLCKAQL